MKTVIYYYTGTGNSLWVARHFKSVVDSDVIIKPIKSSVLNEPTKIIDADAIGIVFPVYIWGLPYSVINFVNKLMIDNAHYNFAIAVNAGQVSNTLVQLKKLMEKRGLTLDSGFSIEMPSSYIPWGGPGTRESQQIKFDAAKKKISEIAYTVEKKYPMEVEKGPWWQRVFFSLVYKLSFNHVADMDKSFWTDEKCNQCGLCEKICPANNIKLTDKPRWLHQCQQCFACLQWCPQKAIQFGKKTIHYERYHHPEITANDLLKPKEDMSKR